MKTVLKWPVAQVREDGTPERLVQLGDARAAAESGIRRKQLETKVKEAA